MTELLLYVLGGLGLALGSGVVFLALLQMETEEEPEGHVTNGWLRSEKWGRRDLSS